MALTSAGAVGCADAGHDEVDDLPGLADHGDRVSDQHLILLEEGLDVGLDAADQLPAAG